MNQKLGYVKKGYKMSVLRPKRECCGYMPDIVSWWRKHEISGDWIKQWEVKCQICDAITSNIAYSEKQAIEMWDNEEVI